MNWNDSTKNMEVLQRPNLLFRFCTSIVSQDANGQIWHSRNLDYSFVDMLRNITIRVDFIKKNQVGEIIFIVVDLYSYTKLPVFVLRLIFNAKCCLKMINGRQWLWNFLLKDFWQLWLAKCSQTDGSVKEIFIYDSWNCLVCRHKNKKGKITEKLLGVVALGSGQFSDIVLQKKWCWKVCTYCNNRCFTSMHSQWFLFMQTVYSGVTYAGYVGLITGMKPKGFTMTLDERGGHSLLLQWSFYVSEQSNFNLLRQLQNK